MVIPTGTEVQINLNSLDVLHGFYVPEFNFSRYASPGYTTSFDFNALHTGDFRGQCTQLCGLYHSLMFFNVKAVTQAQYASWLHTQQAAVKSNPSSAPKLPSGVSGSGANANSSNNNREVTSTVTDVTDVLASSHAGPGLEARPVLHAHPGKAGTVPDDAHAHGHEDHGPDGDPQVADLDRPQGDRAELHDHLAGHVLLRRDHGPLHPAPADLAPLVAPHLRAVQRAVHHARQPDALPVRRAVRLRWPGQLRGAAADRRPRHGVPPAQRPELLALPHRVDHHDAGLPGRRRGGQLRLGGLRPPLQRHQLARASAATSGSWRWS
jgi:hypothetical protein